MIKGTGMHYWMLITMCLLCIFNVTQIFIANFISDSVRIYGYLRFNINSLNHG